MRFGIQIVILILLVMMVTSGLYATSESIWNQPHQSLATDYSIPVSLWMGDGEDYESYLTYQRAPPNITAGWLQLIQNATTPPTDFANKFQWNIFEIAFVFPNLNTTKPAHHAYNQTLMDEVISLLYSRGYHVILAEYDWSGFGSYQWVKDWLNVTAHYKGDNRILAFNLYSEPGCWSQTACTWSKNVTTYQYNSTEGIESAYSNATAAIHAIDSTRTVIWYAPYLQWKIYAPFQESNVVYDYHLYNGNTTEGWISALVGEVLKFQDTYNVNTTCLELDSSGGSKDIFNLTTAVFTIKLLESNHLSWSDWLYGTFTKFWIPILSTSPGLDNGSSSSTTSTSTDYSLSIFSSSSNSAQTTSENSRSTLPMSNSTTRSFETLTNDSSGRFLVPPLTQPDATASGHEIGGLFALTPKESVAASYGASASIIVFLVGLVPLAAVIKRKK